MGRAGLSRHASLWLEGGTSSRNKEALSAALQGRRHTNAACCQGYRRQPPLLMQVVCVQWRGTGKQAQAAVQTGCCPGQQGYSGCASALQNRL